MFRFKNIVIIIAFLFCFIPTVSIYSKSVIKNNKHVTLQEPGLLNTPTVQTESDRNTTSLQSPLDNDFPNPVTVNGNASLSSPYSKSHRQYNHGLYTENISTLAMAPDISGLYGHVTLNGVNANGILLQLRFFNGSSWSTLTTTYTDSNGDYLFSGLSSLASGEAYKVWYVNSTYVSGRIYYWGTKVITEYTSGDYTHMGDFDIADVENLSPSYDSTKSIPTTFSWDKRSATPTDVYELNLFEGGGDLYWFMTIGNNNSHTLNCLPNGFVVYTEYGWYVGVYSPDGGYGFTFSQIITFSRDRSCSGITGQVTQNGTNAGDIYLELRLYDDTSGSYSSRSDFITGSDGSYKFVNVPTLNTGEMYYIRFYAPYNSVSDTLWFWGTNHIDSYTQNSGVAIGDFDIQDISLGLPTHGSAISLPYTITWSIRPTTPTDNYYLTIEDAITYDPYWLFGQGYNNSFTINCLFHGMNTATLYDWWLYINKPGSEAYGTSYYYKQFTIDDGIACKNTFLPTILN